MQGIYGDIMTALERSLDYRLKRHNIISANVANIDTPNYVPRDLDFQQQLSSLVEKSRESIHMARTHDGHLSYFAEALSGKADIVKTPSDTARPDGNRVDLDQEMVKLNENSAMYQASTKVVQKHLAILSYAVQSR